MPPTQDITPIGALNRLVEIATGFCASQAFFAACKLGLFERLGDGPATAEHLAQMLGIHPEGCRRLLNALVNLELVRREGDLYRNSDLGRYCTSGAPVPLEPLSMWGDPFYHMWEFLPDALREYGPRWQQVLGAAPDDVFAALYADPERLRRFTQLLNALGTPQGQEIAERFNFSPYRCILDVAGGTGSLAVQVGLRYPHLQGVVMDLPPVRPFAEEHIQRNGLGDRFTTATADLFSGPYPTGADVVLLGHILHDWGDDLCRTILRHCFDALPPGGVLLICEPVLNEDFSGRRYALMLDLHMLVVSASGGRERTEAEYQALLEGAGFRGIEVIRLEAPRDLIVARKA